MSKDVIKRRGRYATVTVLHTADGSEWKVVQPHRLYYHWLGAEADAIHYDEA